MSNGHVATLELSVSLTGGDQTVEEDVGQVKVCVELDHPPLVPVLVTLTTQPGTALGMGQHY